eukprot:m.60508 g.60508  ORF g.60508 m.60508 type:complete len:636 (+) comp7959_c0_seq1:250-2157(+)
MSAQNGHAQPPSRSSAGAAVPPIVSSARPGILVLYGSQTGTAEDVAERIGREARRRHIHARVVSMDAYPIQQLISERYIVLVAATTGQGDEPDNMVKFWRFLLRKNLPATSLTGLGGVAVFGLGDSSYPKFNYSAIKLHKRLGQLGAPFLTGLGLADDQHPLGVDGALEPWLETLWTNLLARIPLPPGESIIPSTVRSAPRFLVSVSRAEQRAAALQHTHDDRPNVPPHAVGMVLVRNQRITAPDHFQDVRHVTLATRDGSAVAHEPGDVLNLMPHNPPHLVAEMASLFGLGLDDTVVLAPEPGGAGPAVPPFFLDAMGQPISRTVRDVLTQYLDIQAVPRRYFFELLASFATDLREAERLRELCSAEGQEDMYAYSNRVRRTSIEALRDFPSAREGLKTEYMFDLFRPLLPRAFSIASAHVVKPHEIDLTIAIVEYKTRLSTPRLGVCTSWIKSLSPDDRPVVHAWVARGTLQVPPWTVPLVIVGPGTGCAPFRSIVQHRVAQACRAGEGAAATVNVLFFGNRHQEGDYLHREDWEGFQQQGALQVHTAFSRDQDHKIYVQHRMVEQGAALWDLIDRRGAVCLVAGNAKRMPVDVRDALCTVAKTHGHMTDEAAESYVAKLETPKVRRVQFETW